jgi:hypothetical protein
VTGAGTAVDAGALVGLVVVDVGVRVLIGAVPVLVTDGVEVLHLVGVAERLAALRPEAHVVHVLVAQDGVPVDVAGQAPARLGGSGSGVQATVVRLAQEVGGGVSRVLHQQAVLEERQPGADLVDEPLLDLSRIRVALADLLALERGQVAAVFGGAGGLVAAGRAARPLDVHAHRGPVDLACQDGLGQLWEPQGVDLHQAFDPGVRGAIRVAVPVESNRHDHAAGPAVIGVVVVDEDRLAEEGLVALLDLGRGEGVVVVIGAAGDHPRAHVQEPRPGLVVEGDPVRGLEQARAAGLGPPGLQDLQACVLTQQSALPFFPPSGLWPGKEEREGA